MESDAEWAPLGFVLGPALFNGIVKASEIKNMGIKCSEHIELGRVTSSLKGRRAIQRDLDKWEKMVSKKIRYHSLRAILESKSGQEQATWRQEKLGKVVILQQGHEETSRSQVKEEGTLWWCCGKGKHHISMCERGYCLQDSWMTSSPCRADWGQVWRASRKIRAPGNLPCERTQLFQLRVFRNAKDERIIYPPQPYWLY